jgi:hypothetical protein
MTNYTTKDEASTYQMVMAAAMIRKTLEQAERAPHPSNAEEIALKKGMAKFSLRAFNRMFHDREVSGVQVASSLLQLPAYYSPHTELHHINLHYLRRRFQALIQCSDNEDGRNEEHITINLNGSFRISILRMEGSDLRDLCLYEYVKVIRKRVAKHRTGGDIDFHVNYPEHGEKTQVICGPDSIPRTVALVGQLSQYQYNENRIQGGHPEILAMQNDLAAILLALFVPWETLPFLVSDVMSIYGEGCDAHCDRLNHTGLHVCSIVWKRIKDTLPEHVQELAQNVELLRKSKDDIKVDMVERVAAASAMQITFNPDLDDAEEILDERDQITGAVDDDTLRLSYHLIRQRWTREDCVTVADISPL